MVEVDFQSRALLQGCFLYRSPGQVDVPVDSRSSVEVRTGSQHFSQVQRIKIESKLRPSGVSPPTENVDCSHQYPCHSFVCSSEVLNTSVDHHPSPHHLLDVEQI